MPFCTLVLEDRHSGLNEANQAMFQYSHYTNTHTHSLIITLIINYNTVLNYLLFKIRLLYTLFFATSR